MVIYIMKNYKKVDDKIFQNISSSVISSNKSLNGGLFNNFISSIFSK